MQSGDCASEALIVSLSISHVARFNRCGRALRGSVLGLASAQLGMSARNDELKGVDEQLKDMGALRSQSPLAGARYLLGELYYKDAEEILQTTSNAGFDLSAHGPLLRGLKEDGEKGR